MYAHSRPGSPTSEWETLRTHSEAVALAAQRHASAFGWGTAGFVAGALHDIGKAAPLWQAYISSPPESGRKGPDHSSAGAREAASRFGPRLGRWLAYVIAGHHAGLADYDALEQRVSKKAIEPYDEWTEHTPTLPALAELAPARPPKVYPRNGFSAAFLVRMLFSSLVDADFIETEKFYESRDRGVFLSLDVLHDRLQRFLERKRRSDSALNALRNRILDHAVSRAELPPGLFTLTVPTGGGKTLTSLAFALAHAKAHGLRRVIYVIPFTSIIEQTAAVFREALGTDTDILEHHASFDWENASRGNGADDEGVNAAAMLQLASENWDVPIVVTTSVQFFESLYASRPARCRKLHNIARSVVILDEAQALPLKLLLPCMAALDELAANYGTSVVMCTATQPALRECDGFRDPPDHRGPAKKIGFKIGPERELAPEPDQLAQTLRRVTIERLSQPATDAEIVARFSEVPQMLCIVGSRRHAKGLFDQLRGDPRTASGAYHLTTLMCPKHRRAVLQEIRARLLGGKPVRLVSTSLMEAGVDVDFPEVWRAMTGLDSIAQAAGRCNREGRRASGRVVVFTPADQRPPAELEPAIAAAETVFRQGKDPLSLEGMREFFEELYWFRGAEAMDAPMLDGRTWSVLDAITERFNPKNGESTFPFESIAQAFRFIDETQLTVIVPWDTEAVATLQRIQAMDHPRAADLRKLQLYSVPIPKSAWSTWLTTETLRPVHRSLGDQLLCFQDLAHYRRDSGLDVFQLGERESVSNIL